MNLDYRTRPLRVEAIQYTGENFEAIHNFTSTRLATVVKDKTSECLTVSISWQEFTLAVGDWLIYIENVGWHRSSGEAFERMFEPDRPSPTSVTEVIMKACEEREWSVGEMERMLGWPSATLYWANSNIARLNLTPQMAMDLERVLGKSAEYFLSVELNFRRWKKIEEDYMKSKKEYEALLKQLGEGE